jgi:hypothetical protein
MFHGRVELLSEQKTDPHFVNALCHIIFVETDLDSGSFEKVSTSAGAGYRPVAVLGDTHSGTGDDERSSRRYVECAQPVTSRPAGVKQVVSVGA